MGSSSGVPARQLLRDVESVVAGELIPLYEDLHANPELSMREHRTAGVIESQLAALGIEPLRVAGTGVVGVLRNGADGRTVLLRADIDGLPMREETGLDYAAHVEAGDAEHPVPVMHACGHDLHTTALLGAARVLVQHRDAWQGTAVFLFQPGEETAAGAHAMVADGLYDLVPGPDLIIGQHVFPLPAGTVALRSGPLMAAADNLRVRLYGRGGHGSMPHRTVDPVLMAASAILRMQTIVARQLPPSETAVLTVGRLAAGTKENIIPDEAVLDLSLRTFDPDVRERALRGLRQLLAGEALAADAPRDPDIEILTAFPLTINDPAATERAELALCAVLGDERVTSTAPLTTSEDFSVLATACGAPSVYWLLGGADPDECAAAERGEGPPPAINHSSRFAPVPVPTLRTGVEALVTVALDGLLETAS